VGKYDVVIIGSGLSGLQCGYILSKEGYNVCILEQHSQIGGCLQNFKRDNCVFDTGIHYIGSLDEGQVLNKYFKYFELMQNLKLKRMDENSFDVISFDGDPQEYRYAMGHKRFADTLTQYFPKEKNAIHTYLEKIKNICEHFPLYNISNDALNLPEMSFFYENAYIYIQNITKDVKLQKVLAGINPLYAGVKEKTPLYVHALVNNSFIESTWRIVDGSSQVADILASKIKLNGGTIITNNRVTNFIFNNSDELIAVKLGNNEIVEGKTFISTIHPVNTIKMIDEKYLRYVYRKRINSLENTISNFTVYIVCQPDSLEYLNYNHYYYINDNVWISETSTDFKWPGNFLLITPATSASTKYASNAMIMTYMHMDEVKKWEHTQERNRGLEYLEFKKERAESLLDLVERKFPGFRKCIKKYYTSTPLTYRDYTGTVDGSMYGILKDSNDPIKTLISPRTKIPNLYLAGQNIILHGVLGVTIGSITTCSELLGMKYLVKSINDAC
jgi:all-trans-retinol 13,14-reductase